MSYTEADYDNLKQRVNQKEASLNEQNRPNRLNLKFLAYKNGGRDVLVNACRALSNKIKTNQLNTSSISQDLIETTILGSNFSN